MAFCARLKGKIASMLPKALPLERHAGIFSLPRLGVAA
jgi:hypothetical protein